MPDSPTDQAAPSKLDHALRLARLGFRVFPLLANSKRPAITGFPQRATREEAQIVQWWQQHPDRNIGIETTGLLVIDVDDKPNKPGRESFAALATMFGDLPLTYVQKSPTGSIHVVTKAPPDAHIRNSASKVAPGIDIRGWHGYIVGAGSTINGKPYTAAAKHGIADAPQWLVDICHAATPPREERNVEAVAPLDTPDNVKRAQEFLANFAETAIEGAGGDDQTYRTAARVRDLGISEPECVALMLEHYNERCQPPWHPDELADKVANAYRYAENAPGSSTAQADFTNAPLPPQPPESPPTAAPPGPRILHWDDDDDAPEPEPLIEDLFDQQETILLYGAPGVGKSFIAQKMAHCVASGTPFAGRQVERGAVLYVATEGHGGIRKRRKALRKALGGKNLPIDFLLANVNLARNKADREMVRAAADALVERTGQPLRMIVFDTLSASAPGMDENAAGEVSAALLAMRLVASGTGAAVVIVHHEGKNGANGPRGSSAFTGNVDVQIRVATGLITSDKEREAAPLVPIRFDLQVIEVGRTARGRAVTSCVARVYSTAEQAFQRIGMDAHEAKAYAVLRDLCEMAATGEEALGWVNVGDWRDSYREAIAPGTATFTNSARQTWYRCGKGLRDKGWVRENQLGQVVIVEETAGVRVGPEERNKRENDENASDTNGLEQT